jgi:hypothetical protein
MKKLISIKKHLRIERLCNVQPRKGDVRFIKMEIQLLNSSKQEFTAVFFVFICSHFLFAFEGVL